VEDEVSWMKRRCNKKNENRMKKKTIQPGTGRKKGYVPSILSSSIFYVDYSVVCLLATEPLTCKAR